MTVDEIIVVCQSIKEALENYKEEKGNSLTFEEASEELKKENEELKKENEELKKENEELKLMVEKSKRKVIQMCDGMRRVEAHICELIDEQQLQEQ